MEKIDLEMREIDKEKDKDREVCWLCEWLGGGGLGRKTLNVFKSGIPTGGE